MFPQGLSTSQSATATGRATSGDAAQNTGTDHSGFNVNFGDGVKQGAESSALGVPSWVWLAAVGVAMAVIWKRYT